MNLETIAVPAQSALFSDASPVDAIHSALGILSVLRENFANESENFPTWITIGAVESTIRSALARM